MKRFLYRTVLFAILPAFFVFGIMFIDPLNYFGWSHIVSNLRKTQVNVRYAGRDMLKNGTLKMANFRHGTYDNLLVGDSRVMPVDTAYLHKLTGETWYNFALQGSGIQSVCSAFWWAIEHGCSPGIVYFGLNFWNSTSPNYFTEIDDVCSSMLTYICSKTVFRLVRDDLFLSLEDETISENTTWEDVLSWKKEAVKDVQVLDSITLQCLKEVIEYCETHHIRLIFVLPPEHQDIMKILQSSENADACYSTFLETFAPYEFYNFNTIGWIEKTEDFSDPMHPHSHVYYAMSDSIF